VLKKFLISFYIIWENFKITPEIDPFKITISEYFLKGIHQILILKLLSTIKVDSDQGLSFD